MKWFEKKSPQRQKLSQSELSADDALKLATLVNPKAPAPPTDLGWFYEEVRSASSMGFTEMWTSFRGLTMFSSEARYLLHEKGFLIMDLNLHHPDGKPVRVYWDKDYRPNSAKKAKRK